MDDQAFGFYANILKKEEEKEKVIGIQRENGWSEAEIQSFVEKMEKEKDDAIARLGEFRKQTGWSEAGIQTFIRRSDLDDKNKKLKFSYIKSKKDKGWDQYRSERKTEYIEMEWNENEKKWDLKKGSAYLDVGIAQNGGKKEIVHMIGSTQNPVPKPSPTQQQTLQNSEPPPSTNQQQQPLQTSTNRQQAKRTTKKAPRKQSKQKKRSQLTGSSIKSLILEPTVHEAK